MYINIRVSRSSYHTNISFSDETLSSEILPFVKPPKAIFPMSKTSGPKDALSPKTVSLEKNLGYDPRYVQSTSIWRSPIWSMNLDHQSYMEMDMSAMATESLKQFSILLWINPSFQQMPPAWILVSKIYFLFHNCIFIRNQCYELGLNIDFYYYFQILSSFGIAD